MLKLITPLKQSLTNNSSTSQTTSAAYFQQSTIEDTLTHTPNWFTYLCKADSDPETPDSRGQKVLASSDFGKLISKLLSPSLSLKLLMCQCLVEGDHHDPNKSPIYTSQIYQYQRIKRQGHTPSGDPTGPYL